MEEIILTDNGRRVLEFMQSHDEVWIGKDMSEQTGIKGIYPVLNSLKKKGLIEDAESISRDFTNSKGETKLKDYKTYKLTDLGRMYVI